MKTQTAELIVSTDFKLLAETTGDGQLEQRRQDGARKILEQIEKATLELPLTD